jgi:hypothetical protein
MGRGRGFSLFEEELLLDNYDLTTAELELLFKRHGYNRSRKSISRKLEKLRESGQIGLRSKDTVRRSYRQRSRISKASPSRLDSENSSGEFGGGAKFGGDSKFGGGAKFGDDLDEE